MICAVTGANGFVGGRCADRLAAAGHRVVRLVRRPSEAGDRTFLLGSPLEQSALRGVDALIHCAYDFGALGWEQVRHVNVGGSALLLYAAKAARVRKVVFVSSVSAFDGCVSAYGRGKLEVERLTAELGGVSLRPGLVWSEAGRGMFGALGRMARLPVLPVFDGGVQPLVLAHVDDVAEAVLRAIDWDRAAAPEPVTLAHPRPVPFAEVLRRLAAAEGRTLRLLSVPGGPSILALRAAEAVGLKLPFRSDSLVSLRNPNPRLDFSAAERLGLKFRPF